MSFGSFKKKINPEPNIEIGTEGIYPPPHLFPGRDENFVFFAMRSTGFVLKFTGAKQLRFLVIKKKNQKPTAGQGRVNLLRGISFDFLYLPRYTSGTLLFFFFVVFSEMGRSEASFLILLFKTI